MTTTREHVHQLEHTQPLNIVVLVPAYNEEESISDVIRDASKFASRIIVCDDGSTDSTYRYSVDSRAEVIRHSQNSGYGAALGTLCCRASDRGAAAFIPVDSAGLPDSR